VAITTIVKVLFTNNALLCYLKGRNFGGKKIWRVGELNLANDKKL